MYIAQPFFQMQHGFPNCQEPEMPWLDNAGVDWPHWYFVDTGSLRLQKGIVAIRLANLRVMVGCRKTVA